jgi:hypothetical protein
MAYTFATYNGETMIPDNLVWTLRYNTMVHSSALNGYTQTYELPGARWVARMDFTNLSKPETDTLVAWLSRLKGMAGRFFLYDFSCPTTQNGLNAINSGTISSAATSADDSIINFSAGVDLAVGDKFTVADNKELKTVVQVNSATQVVVAPGFRNPTSYYAGQTISTGEYATVRMMLDSDDQATKAVESKLLLGSISISCVEIFSASGGEAQA